MRTLASLVSLFVSDARIIGNPDVEVHYMRKFDGNFEKSGGITFALAKKIPFERLYLSKADVIITDHDVRTTHNLLPTCIVTKSARLQMAKFTHVFAHPIQTLEETDYTNPDGTITHIMLSPRAFIDQNVSIGNGTHIFANVTIYQDVIIGENCRIESNSVVGADGLGFERDENGDWFKIAHLGGVVIGNNVEIGAGACINRGALGDTIIEDNVKIFNLANVAHNSRIRRNTLIISHSMVSGSCDIGENVWLAPGSVISDGIIIGSDAFVGLGSVVIRNVENNSLVYGNPARKREKRKL